MLTSIRKAAVAVAAAAEVPAAAALSRLHHHTPGSLPHRHAAQHAHRLGIDHRNGDAASVCCSPANVWPSLLVAW